jgi:hypothetical protein
MAGRMGASISVSAGMQEMVVEARREYEDLGARLASSGAIAIAADGDKKGKGVGGGRLYRALRQRLCWRRPFHPLMRPLEWMHHYDRALAAVHEVAVADTDEDHRANRREATPLELFKMTGVEHMPPVCKVPFPTTRHIIVGDPKAQGV